MTFEEVQDVGNVMRVWGRDLKRLATTPAAWTVVLFLMVLPSLYTWFNVAGFWNPYDNTGNLRVCVVNEDAGATTDELGALDLGAQIVDQLELNDQLGWAFVTREEAEEGVRAGTAYAAFVIPPDFSANVGTLLSGDLRQPRIEYYVNEKTGPVAPKITDTGASALDATINETFVSTVAETLAIVLGEKLDDVEQASGQAKSSVVARLANAHKKAGEAHETLSSLADDANAAKAQTASARGGLEQARGQLDALADDLEKLSTLTGAANTALIGFTERTGTTLDDVSQRLSELSARTTAVAAQDASALAAAKGDADAAIASTRATLAEIDQAVVLLENLRDQLPGGIDKSPLEAAIEKAHDIGTRAKDELASLQRLSNDLGGAAANAESATTATDNAVQQTLASIADFRTVLGESTVPAISAALASIAKAAAETGVGAAEQKNLVRQGITALDELDAALDACVRALGKTNDKLGSLESDIDTLLVDVTSLSASNLLGRLVSDGEIDPKAIADFMMSPTQLVTEELYPLNAYGSAMAPLFINLTLWIGVFMLMVIMRLEVDDGGFERLTITQRFFGRFLLLAPIACAQAAICCVGCMALGIQTANVGAFFATAIIASLSYLAIQYSLSTTLQHAGKALCVILVFVQIPGATGLYPIEMTPEFFRIAYPLFPFTYGINAIRETISGFYGTQWLSYIGVLAGFFVAFMLIGSFVRPYLTNLNRMFAREIGESDLIMGESIELPARRWRMSQVVRALSDREEYRAALDVRIASFMRIYPRLIGAALVIGIAVPIVSTPIMLLIGVEKVIVLTTWLIWLVIAIAYLLVVEFIRDNLSHQATLEDMEADKVRSLVAGRNTFTRVKALDHDIVGKEDRT